MAAPAPAPAPPPPLEDEARVRPADLGCAVCFGLLCEPLTLPCGHSFCRPCLVSSLERQKRCPSCRAPCHLDAAAHPASVALVQLLRSAFPRRYEARLAEVAEEKSRWRHKLPVFLSPSSLVPGQPLALHLFEPRYRLMARRAMEGGRRFVVVASAGGSSLATGAVGVVVDIEDAKFMSEGRALLRCRGRERVVTEEAWVEAGTFGLHYCRFRELPDEPDPAASAARVTPLVHAVRAQVARLASLVPSWAEVESHYGAFPGGTESLSAAAARLASDTRPLAPVPQREAERLSFWLVSVLPDSDAVKCRVMAGQSLVGRLEEALVRFATFVDGLYRRRSEQLMGGVVAAPPAAAPAAPAAAAAAPAAAAAHHYGPPPGGVAHAAGAAAPLHSAPEPRHFVPAPAAARHEAHAPSAGAFGAAPAGAFGAAPAGAFGAAHAAHSAPASMAAAAAVAAAPAQAPAQEAHMHLHAHIHHTGAAYGGTGAAAEPRPATAEHRQQPQAQQHQQQHHMQQDQQQHHMQQDQQQHHMHHQQHQHQQQHQHHRHASDGARAHGAGGPLPPR